MLILPGRFPAQLFLWWNPGWISLKTVVRTTCWIFLRAEWPTHRCWWCRVLEYKMFLSPSLRTFHTFRVVQKSWFWLFMCLDARSWMIEMGNKSKYKSQSSTPSSQFVYEASYWPSSGEASFWTMISYGTFRMKCHAWGLASSRKTYLSSSCLLPAKK